MTKTRHGAGRPIWAAVLFTAILTAAGCKDEDVRMPVPANLVDQVEVPGYTAIRFWGDKDTPAFDAALKAHFVALKTASAAGQMPDATAREDVLAISGGGDKGAFAAGYLKGWTERGTRPTFDTVTGVSTGALAAPFAFLGAAHDRDLEDIYTQTGGSQLYDSRWDFGLFSNALKDTGPLKKLIERFATDALLDEIAAQYKIGRRLVISTTNLDAQRPVIWDLSAIAASGRPDRRELFVNLLLASSAVPGIFPPVKIRVTTRDGRRFEELHADGSVTMQMFFMPPHVKLDQTETAVFGKPRMRTLYVLRNGKLAPEYAATIDKAADLLQRGVDTLVKYQVVYNLRLLERAAQDTRTAFKFMGIPASFDAMPRGLFDKDYADKLFAAGRAAGAQAQWLDDVPDSPELTEMLAPAPQRGASR